ncbi:hypothetical protein HFN68_28975 [Rhizobium laguerreae]|uniref:hypothetical protein n=1 Tax=Rhizobium laguerreae TaxID=1076926 RepID=UPI001C91BE54|nr:hypothetical protein [Rhizobium laguerreae]MBY3536915.1 hypothetical protein [Rhizobium laguerreae]
MPEQSLLPSLLQHGPQPKVNKEYTAEELRVPQVNISGLVRLTRYRPSRARRRSVHYYTNTSSIFAGIKLFLAFEHFVLSTSRMALDASGYE